MNKNDVQKLIDLCQKRYDKAKQNPVAWKILTSIRTYSCLRA